MARDREFMSIFDTHDRRGVQAARPWKCPHCGNTNRALMGDNGGKGRDLSLLCEAPIPVGEEDSFGRTVGEPKTGDVYLDSEGTCDMQWEPSEQDDGEGD